MMLASDQQYPLDHVVWSLVHELRLSLLLPLLVVMGVRRGILITLALAVGVSGSAELVRSLAPLHIPLGYHGFVFDAKGLDRSVLVTLRFLICFAFGATLALKRRALMHLMAGRRWLEVPCITIAMIALSQPNEFIMTLGAVIVVQVASADGPIRSTLALSPLRWLGTISFSLYLIHLPLLLVIGIAFRDKLSSRAATACAIATSFIAAEVLYRLVEAPSIRLSRLVGQWLADKPSRADPPSDASTIRSALYRGKRRQVDVPEINQDTKPLRQITAQVTQ